MARDLLSRRAAVTCALVLGTTLCWAPKASAQIAVDADISVDQQTAKSSVTTAAFSTFRATSCCWLLSPQITCPAPTLQSKAFLGPG